MLITSSLPTVAFVIQVATAAPTNADDTQTSQFSRRVWVGGISWGVRRPKAATAAGASLRGSPWKSWPHPFDKDETSYPSSSTWGQSQPRSWSWSGPGQQHDGGVLSVPASGSHASPFVPAQQSAPAPIAPVPETPRATLPGDYTLEPASDIGSNDMWHPAIVGSESSAQSVPRPVDQDAPVFEIKQQPQSAPVALSPALARSTVVSPAVVSAAGISRAKPTIVLALPSVVVSAAPKISSSASIQGTLRPSPSFTLWPSVDTLPTTSLTAQVANATASASALPSPKKTPYVQTRISKKGAICRKFPDTITSSTASVRVFPAKSPINLSCWSSPSMDDDKYGGNAIWLKSDDFNCYFNEADVDLDGEYPWGLKSCASSKHWAVGVKKAYKKKLNCYQCASLKCPVVETIGQAEKMDVQCLVDGETVKGNSTWIRPFDRTCMVSASSLIVGSWLGTPGGKC